MPIPRKIHYCWFGHGEKPELVKRCIESWKKYCPDCEIIEWNESNYDVTKNTYMYQAYQTKRWGFATDYARLDIIYTHGGVYLDTDVELIRNIDMLFAGDGFLGFEYQGGSNADGYLVNTGQGFGAPAGHEVIKRLMDAYDNEQFVKTDGTQNLQTCPYYNTDVLVGLGLRRDNRLQKIGGLTVYPSEVFCPLDWNTRKLSMTENTFSIHHFDASWVSVGEKKKRRMMRRLDYIIHIPNILLKKVLGAAAYDRLKNQLRKRRS